MATQLHQFTLVETQRGLRARDFSVEELVNDYLLCIEKQDVETRAYLEIFSDARKQAIAADLRLSNATAPLPPLMGIPLAIKDNILIEGRCASAASSMLERYVAPYDATVISRLKDQGAIFLGRTNMDEFAMGSSTENSWFGSTKNPHDPERVPGGSSGGSAAAVAAHLCAAALGSDTGGSIRQPASFCGVVGMKPTYGAVSRNGLIAMASSLDQIGPLAKSVEDAAIIFEAIAGVDSRDSTTAASSSSPRDLIKGMRELRIGVPREYFASGLDADVGAHIQDMIGRAANAGARVTNLTLPHAAYALPAYYIIVSSEISANLARFDGIRYGSGASGAQTLSEAYASVRSQGFGAEVKRRIMLGTYALSAGYYDAYYKKAQQVRRLIRDDFERAFREVDVIVSPTTPTPAFRIGERAHNPVQMYLADIYTVAVNLAGVPALSLPTGLVTREGRVLPVGLQLIAKHFDEELLFRAAKEFSLLAG